MRGELSANTGNFVGCVSLGSPQAALPLRLCKGVPGAAASAPGSRAGGAPGPPEQAGTHHGPREPVPAPSWMKPPASPLIPLLQQQFDRGSSARGHFPTGAPILGCSPTGYPLHFIPPAQGPKLNVLRVNGVHRLNPYGPPRWCQIPNPTSPLLGSRGQSCSFLHHISAWFVTRAAPRPQ